MNRSFSARAWPIALMFVLVAFPALAQNVPADKAATYRRLAPGVLETVDPMRALDESVSRHDIVELLAVDQGFDWAKDIPFRHDVWVLEFKFKPMRMEIGRAHV